MTASLLVAPPWAGEDALWLDGAPESYDPTDWAMWSDILQDRGLPEAVYARPRRVARSLSGSGDSLYLMTRGLLLDEDQSGWSWTMQTGNNVWSWRPNPVWFRCEWLRQIVPYEFGAYFSGYPRRLAAFCWVMPAPHFLVSAYFHALGYDQEQWPAYADEAQRDHRHLWSNR